jgi:hypothetical protein
MDEFKVNVNTNPASTPSVDVTPPAPDTTPEATPEPETVISPMNEDPFKPDEPKVPVVSNKKGGMGKKFLVVLLVLVLIAAAGGVVYYWQNKQVKDSQANAATLNTKVTDLSKQLATAQAAATKVADTTTTNTFKIPELSIQMTVAPTIKDLTYSLRNGKYDDGTTFLIADISSKTLTDLDKNCASTATPPFGGLTRTNGTAPKTQATATSEPVALKQFPNFYIGQASSQANCSTTKAVQDKVTALKKDYTTALGTVVIVQ